MGCGEIDNLRDCRRGHHSICILGYEGRQPFGIANHQHSEIFVDLVLLEIQQVSAI